MVTRFYIKCRLKCSGINGENKMATLLCVIRVTSEDTENKVSSPGPRVSSSIEVAYNQHHVSQPLRVFGVHSVGGELRKPFLFSG